MPTRGREVGVREASAVGNWEAATPVRRLLLLPRLPPSVHLALAAEELRFLTRPGWLLFFSSRFHAGADCLLNLADRLDSSHVVFIFHVRPFRLGVRETERPVFRSYCPPVRSSAPALGMDLFPLRLSPRRSLSLF